MNCAIDLHECQADESTVALPSRGRRPTRSSRYGPDSPLRPWPLGDSLDRSGNRRRAHRPAGLQVVPVAAPEESELSSEEADVDTLEGPGLIDRQYVLLNGKPVWVEDKIRIRELVLDGPLHGAARVELKLLCRRLLVYDEPIAPASS